MKSQHLRNLLQDPERCHALTADHKEILMDYSRQLVLPETIVSPSTLTSLTVLF